MKITTEDIFLLVAKTAEGYLGVDDPAIIARFISIGWIEPDKSLTETGRQYLDKALAIQKTLRDGVSIIDRKRITTAENWLKKGPWYQFVLKSPTSSKMKIKERYHWHTDFNGFLMLGDIPGFTEGSVTPLPKEHYKDCQAYIEAAERRTFTGYLYEPTVYQRPTLSGWGLIWFVAPEQQPIAIQETFFDIMLATHPTAGYYALHNNVRKTLTVSDRAQPPNRFNGLVGAIGTVNTSLWPMPKVFSRKRKKS